MSDELEGLIAFMIAFLAFVVSLKLEYDALANPRQFLFLGPVDRMLARTGLMTVSVGLMFIVGTGIGWGQLQFKEQFFTVIMNTFLAIFILAWSAGFIRWFYIRHRVQEIREEITAETVKMIALTRGGQRPIEVIDPNHNPPTKPPV